MPVSVTALLPNVLSQLPAPGYQKRLIPAGLTAAKKLVATRWKNPYKLSVSNWIFTFLDVIYLELSTACAIGVKEFNIGLWVSAAEKLREPI